MVPDRGFTKQLKALDKELDVMWNWGSEKWEIWRFPENKESHHVLTVETKDKTYRQLGTDILLKLQMCDTHRYTLKQLIAYFDELDNQVERRKREEFENKMKDAVDEIWKFHWRPGGIGFGEVPIRIQVPKQLKVRRVIENANE